MGFLAAALVDSTREWRKELEHLELPPEAVTWQEQPGGVSVGALFLHIIEAEFWWFQAVAGGQPLSDEDVKRYQIDEIDQYADTWPTPPSLSIEDCFDMLQEARERSLALFPTIGPADRIVKRPDADTTYTIRWIQLHIVQHDSYHGGQIVMLAKRWKAKLEA